MKSLVTALILSTLAAPVLALHLPVAGVAAPSSDEFGRRSGRCPHRPEAPVVPGQDIAREGSACGGV